MAGPPPPSPGRRRLIDTAAGWMSSPVSWPATDPSPPSSPARWPPTPPAPGPGWSPTTSAGWSTTGGRNTGHPKTSSTTSPPATGPAADRTATATPAAAKSTTSSRSAKAATPTPPTWSGMPTRTPPQTRRRLAHPTTTRRHHPLDHPHRTQLRPTTRHLPHRPHPPQTGAGRRRGPTATVLTGNTEPAAAPPSDTGVVDDDRDVAAFADRARGYDDGWLGRLHHDVAQRVMSIALSATSTPNRVLDVGCGTGHLLRLLAQRCSHAVALRGVDAAAEMVRVARAASTDARIDVREGRAENLPFADGEFDLVVSTTSFDHWQDQQAGLAECARVLAQDGTLVLADLFSPLLTPTLIGSRRDKARTRPRAERLVTAAGLHVISWRNVYPLIGALVARRNTPSIDHTAGSGAAFSADTPPVER